MRLFTGFLLVRQKVTILFAVVATAATGAALTGTFAAAAGTYTQYTLVASGPGPVAITAGPDGNVWFAVPGGSSTIGRITPSGTQTLFSSGLSSQLYNGLGTITAGPDGNVWFTEQKNGPNPNGLVGWITPAGVIQETSAGLQAGQQPTGITTGPDGNLWITDSGGPTPDLVRLTPSGTATDFTSVALANAQLSSPTAGPDGNVWFIVSGGSYGGTGGIGQITPSGTITVFTAGLTANAKPTTITSSPNGALWFTQNDGAAGGVGEITPTGTITELPEATFHNTQPLGIAAAADGNLYISEAAGPGTVVQITPSGTVTAVVSGPDGHPAAMAAQSAGDVWVAQTNTNSLGRLAIAVPVSGSTGGTGSTGSTGSTGTTGPGGSNAGGSGSGQTGANTPGVDIKPPAQPVLGVKFLARPSGLVLVRTSPHGPLVQLADAADLPVGSFVDTRSGTLQLVMALPHGTQTATVGRGRFIVRQPRHGHGMTALALAGGSFRACPPSHSPVATIASTRKRSKKPKQVIRQLWSKDHNGHFQTDGHNSVATVRGTEWLTQDRCDGTLTHVIKGVVTVHPNGSHHPVTLTAGHSYLAR